MIDSIQSDVELVPGVSGILLQVRELTVQTRDGESLLSGMSFHVEPGDLVVLMGLSRPGGSLLLKSLAGVLKPTGGDILIDGLDLYAHLKAFGPIIGFVPAEFGLHPSLTVAEILYDSARLRLPRGISSQERSQRIQTVLQSVALTQVMDRRVALLSEVERRRLSIAVELLGHPKLLLLDESAEPLTPFDEVQITILMRDLSRQGITILQVNSRGRSAGLADKILFLGPGGSLAWFGPSEEALAYLKGFLPRGVVKDLFSLQEALEMLVNPRQLEVGVEWAKRFKAQAAYEKYVDDPLHDRYPDLLLQTRPLLRIRLRNASKGKLPPTILPRASVLQKFLLLLRRDFRVLWRDKAGFFMLVIPALVAMIHFFFASMTQPDGGRMLMRAGLPFFLVIVTAAFLVQNEIFKERMVYQREQRTTPLLFPYILSKVALVGLLALYQGLVWTIIHSLGEIGQGPAGGVPRLLSTGIILILVAFVGGILGLMVSALSRATLTMNGWVLLLTVPLALFVLDPLSHWSKLAIISLVLVLLLLVIQSRAAGVMTEMRNRPVK